jgi:hypothetical protein
MENILENNRLIAEFLGQKSDKYEFPQFGYMNTKGDFITEFNDSQLKFHKDWNWLMPVVEKISHLYDFFNIENDLKDLRINANINDVYSACLSFVKHYNNQN